MAGQQSLVDYCQGFQRASEPWPPLPLADDITISWWRQLIKSAPDVVVQGADLLETLQSVLPQALNQQQRSLSAAGAARKGGQTCRAPAGRARAAVAAGLRQ